MTRPRSPLRAFAARLAHPSIMFALWLLAGLVAGSIGGTERCAAEDGATALARGRLTASGNSYVLAEEHQWTLGSDAVELVLALQEGRLLVTSFRNKPSDREMKPAGRVVEAIVSPVAGAEQAGPWRLDGATTTILPQGELQLDLTLQRGPLVATAAYVVYPGTSVIRRWFTYRNAGDAPLTIVDPEFLGVTVGLGDDLSALDFHWMTGARNEPGCWTLRTLRLLARKPEVFDSYDPFPGLGGRATRGDGIGAKIMLNGRRVWPIDADWRPCPGDRDYRAEFDLELDVTAGDRVAFVVHCHGDVGYDTTDFDPVIAYQGGPKYIASEGCSDQQSSGGWDFGYFEAGEWHELKYDASAKRWRPEDERIGRIPFIEGRLLHPGPDQDVARQWTAPQTGRIRLSGVVCNVGDAGLGISSGEHRMASKSYAPWYALHDRTTGDGLVIGWDYMGHWSSRFTGSDKGIVEGSLRVAGHRQTLAPGQEVTTPRAFVAVFREDLDHAGNELLQWQYRYLWDYTREGWFPAIPMLVNWHKGTGWNRPGVSWWGSGDTDIPSQFTKIFRAADLLRYVGGDLYHRDWGWWDRAGDWNGPDFGASGRYLRKYGLGQVIYAFLYTVDPESRLAEKHPDWLIGETLDMSKPEVVEHLQWQLDDFHRRWGDFAWRNDSTPTAPRDGDDTVLLAQDQNFRKIIRSFLDKYPGSSFQGVNGGGNEAGYDYVRLSGMFQFSDGVIGPLRNYYASLLFPPDKLMDNGDQWRPENFDAATWRGLLSMAIVSTGDTWDREKLEGLRELSDVYHYLAHQGVVGRWVWVYRPRVEGDDPTMYLQRLSRDRLRGVIVPARAAPSEVAIHPKGLEPDQQYHVTFHESPAEERRTGRDLAERGIRIERMAPGEVIYLNLPMHPGSQRDRQPPGPPGDVVKRRGENMGYPGVELQWAHATDDNWVSYYVIRRDGREIDKVARGTFTFDHSAGADLAASYEIVAVDGAGNRSTPAAADGPKARPAQVFDDQDSGLAYSGAWRRERGLQPAHLETISFSDEPQAAVEVAFEGRRVLWFSKLGDDCGKAVVSIDGGPPETVDTYCSDDVWGVCVFRRELSSHGKHAIRITVAGRQNARAQGQRIYLDGIRAEAD